MLSLPTDLKEQKTALRRELRALRRSIAAEDKATMDAAMIGHVLRTECYRNAAQLWLYAPLSDEPALLPIATQALADGKQIAFPISHPETHTLSFHTVKSLAELREGTYGIFEPPCDAPTAKDTGDTLCLVPALCFDRAGYRLGYGGGYYDRLLADFAGRTIGLCYQSLLQPALPRGPYDRAVALLITEKGVLLPDEKIKTE